MIDPSEALLDSRHHEVAHVLALDPFGGGDMTHGLTVATVEREGDANFLGIVAGDLEAVRTPAQVRLCDSNLAVMAAFFMGAGMLTKKKSVNTHDAVDALAVDRLTPFGDRLTAQNSPDAPIAVGGHSAITALISASSPSSGSGGRPLRFGVRPAARSATFERATPIVPQTVFIANRPWAETATATSVFLTRSRYRALP